MPDNPASGVIQKLQAELRERRVEAERYRIDLDDLRTRAGKPDPRLARLAAEVERLRQELTELREQRDVLEAGVRTAVDKLRRG